jgi:unsaturated rhamnogalacturonyl hydrolase
MQTYFESQESIHYQQGHYVPTIIETIANKYISANPPSGFTFRTIHPDTCKQMEDGRSDLNLNMSFPESPLGSYGYAYAMVYSNQQTVTELSLSCYGPARIFVNGSLFYRSTMADDVNVNHHKLLNVPLKRGWNAFFITLIKTSSGFGCRFGSSNSKWFPIHFLSPFQERTGMGGWVYALGNVPHDYTDGTLPAIDSLEAEMGLDWLPRLQESTSSHSLSMLFGAHSGKLAYAWSSVYLDEDCDNPLQLQGTSSGKIRLWVDHELVITSEQGAFEVTLTLSAGKHDIVIESICSEKTWNYQVFAEMNSTSLDFRLPVDVKGTRSPWLYLGPLDEAIEKPDRIRTLYRYEPQENVYWKSAEGYSVRPYLENELFAKWNYPLGVTLYGLLQAGQELGRADILAYVTRHIDACTQLYEYAKWDKDTYGYPAINHQLVELNMLDDCGSFGSAMLEAYETNKNPTYLTIAHTIADYIMNTQERKENGAFYRQRDGEYQTNTLWADDLYMSTPFLTRYYKHTGDIRCVDEAARQFLLFKPYLYIPELQAMSHVYDFKYETATYVPWGRGNGWVIFSLSELLAVLPQDHSKRPELVQFFRQLAEGYLKLQGANGLWHQVLTDPTSYEETSCTAMFIYAFSRGIRYGWLDETGPYKKAITLAWEALTKIAIDATGNIYGVCRGSGYSFTPAYYKEELGWILNDTHGIGIVMLSGIEFLKCQTGISHK